MIFFFRISGKGIAASEGVINLQSHTFEGKKIYKLGGDWLLYPSRFLDPETETPFPGPGLIQEVPGTWDDRSDPRGFATYRLKVQLPDECGPLALLMPSLSTAYSLYIDGVQLGSNGKASTTRSGAVSQYKYEVIPLGKNCGETNILIHVSNFDYAKGGMWTAPLLGPQKAVTGYFRNRIFTETLIAGGVMLVGIILLTLFIVRREFLSYANLGIFCLIMGIRTLIVGEIPLTFFYPDFNWSLMIRLEYLSMSVGFIFINAYFYNIYSRFYKRGIFAVLNSLAGLFSIFILLAPVYIFTGQVLVVQLIMVAGIINVFYLFAKSSHEMKEENTILIAGITLLLLMVILDILISHNKLMFLPFKINTSYGLIILILSNSFILIRQAARITMQLQRLTNNLEELVRKRTGELETANLKLSEQAVTDLLTGVSNRHKFANVMKTEEARFKRTGSHYAALYLDLDNFKYINDTFGHPAGDLILKHFGQILKAIVRESDYLFRLGGDEFFILMTGIPTIEEGITLAARILEETAKWMGFREELEEFLGYPVNIPKRKSLSLSIGISSTGTPGIDSLHTLPSRADKALLRAKAEGKNRYAVYTEEDEEDA